MKNLKTWIGILILASYFNACKTEDIEPEKPVIIPNGVSLSISKNVISEANDSVILRVELGTPSANNIQVKLAYSGSAILSKDFIVRDSILTIQAGSLFGSTVLVPLQDTAKIVLDTIKIDIDVVTGGIEVSTQSATIFIEDDDSPAPIKLIFNEVLYDPGSTVLDGDANGDGVRDANQDEFIEFYNNSSKPIDLSGFKIFDATALLSDSARHIIPNGTVIEPNKVLVIFGGGTPTGTFGNATVQTATSGELNMTNAGDVITLKDAANNVVITLDIEPWSNNPDEAYTRNPDITGDFVQHASIDPLKPKKFSPGTKVNGSPF